MKSIYFVVIFLFLSSSCIINSKRTEDLFTLNVEKDCPVKEITLQDIAEIDYIKLETCDSFLVSGRPRLVTNSNIIYTNREGELIFFDLKGKFSHKFGHKGNGPQEYGNIGNMVYDEDTKLLFVNAQDKIQVYGLYGEFKHSIPVKENSFYWPIYNFDKETLLVYDTGDNAKNPFILINKQDGALIKTLSIEAKADIGLMISVDQDGQKMTFTGKFFNAVRHQDGYLLSELSCDTVYRLGADRNTTPFLVRMPDIRSMNPPIFLNALLETDDYYFGTTIKKEFDLKSLSGFPEKGFVIDKRDNKMYKQNILNRDFDTQIIVLDPVIIERTNDCRIGLISLSVDKLLEAYQKGDLHAALHDLCGELNEDDNPIVMLIHFK